MSYAGMGLGYRRSLGQVAIEREVPYKDEVTGAEGVAVASTGPNCGDPYAVQVMLYWLGFYEGPIQGTMDQKTRGALAAYALSRGIPYNPSSTPSGVVCAALIADHEAYWQTQQLSPPSTGGGCAPGQWGFPPFCMGTATPERPAAADKCPEGMVGMPPYCVSLPTSVPQPASGACPPGTIGYPPHCYGVPQGLPTTPPATLPTSPPVDKLPPPPTGGGGALPPTTTPGLPPTQAPGGWWSERSDGEKTAIIGGGIAAAIVIVLAIKNK